MGRRGVMEGGVGRGRGRVWSEGWGGEGEVGSDEGGVGREWEGLMEWGVIGEREGMME